MKMPVRGSIYKGENKRRKVYEAYMNSKGEIKTRKVG